MQFLIITILLNIILVLISFYLLFLYCKSKDFNTYSCYNNIILSFIILIDNLLRLIPTDIIPYISAHYIQAFLLTFLDKLLLTTITSQAIIIYLGKVKTQFYYKHEGKIFFTILFLTIFIDLSIAIAFFIISQKITNYKDINYEGNSYFYYEGLPHIKKGIDVIFNSIFFCLNIYSVIRALIYTYRQKKQASLGLIQDLDYGHYYSKILIMFFVNSITFIVSFLIIYQKIPIQYIDFIYLTVCLFVDLSYTLNKKIKKETLKIFCKNRTSNNNLRIENEEEEEIEADDISSNENDDI